MLPIKLIEFRFESIAAATNNVMFRKHVHSGSEGAYSCLMCVAVEMAKLQVELMPRVFTFINVLLLMRHGGIFVSF